MPVAENAYLFIGSTQIKFTPMGAPGAPTNFTLKDLTLSWSAGDVGTSGPTLGYGVEVEPRGPVITIDNSTPTVGGTATLENVQPDVEYTFSVYAVNQAGRGSSAVLTHTFAYNIATGGTVTDVDDYNGSGQKWRVHTFTSDGTLNVDLAAQPFRVFACGGGGGGQKSYAGPGAGLGGNGYHYVSATQVLDPDSYAFTVGGGGGGGNSDCGGTGGTTTAFGQSLGGGTGGCGKPSAGHPYGPGVTSNITGTSVLYCKGGGNTHYGDGGGTRGGNGYPGKPGVVFVAYQIG